MQQVLNWITANPAAVMVAGAGVALALGCWLVLRRGRKPYHEVLQDDLDRASAKLAKAAAKTIKRDDAGEVYIGPAASNKDRLDAILAAGCFTGPSPYAEATRKVKRDTPYGSKPDETKRPVTRGELDTLLHGMLTAQGVVNDRLAALEKLATTDSVRISSSMPHGVRAWRWESPIRMGWLWDGAKMWREGYNGAWYASKYDDPAALTQDQPTLELHGPELAEVYASWLKRGDK